MNWQCYSKSLCMHNSPFSWMRKRIEQLSFWSVISVPSNSWNNSTIHLIRLKYFDGSIWFCPLWNSKLYPSVACFVRYKIALLFHTNKLKCFLFPVGIHDGSFVPCTLGWLYEMFPFGECNGTTGRQNVFHKVHLHIVHACNFEKVYYG